MENYNRDFHSNRVIKRPIRKPMDNNMPTRSQTGVSELPTDRLTVAPEMPRGRTPADEVPRRTPASTSSELPTGRPAGLEGMAVPTRAEGMDTTPPGEQPPTTVESTYFTPGYLETQVGKMMRIEFLIGTTGPLVDRIGELLQVGASYILLKPIGTDGVLLCDIYSIKFVYIYENPLQLDGAY